SGDRRPAAAATRAPEKSRRSSMAIDTEPKHDEAGPRLSGFDRFFSITERGSTVAREARGGLVTFVTMVYIVVLNPLIIGTVKDAHARFTGVVQDPALS